MYEPSRADRLARRIIVISLVVLLVAGAMSLIKVPYAIEAPGPVSNTLGTLDEGGKSVDLISVKGHQTYPATGKLYFTTVTVQGGPEQHISAWEWLFGHLDPDAEVVPEEQVFGTGYSEQQIKQMNTAEMQGSQKNAIAAALRSTGATVAQRNVVGSIAEKLPAAGVLELKDEIVEVDSRPVRRVEDITAAISSHAVGDSVAITVRRNGAERTLSLRTVDIGGGRAGIGVGIEALYDYPYEVTIDAGDVGGPSAGTMFALAVRERITPGDQTGGKAIAGTGTIDDSGRVGPIGGIAQKMVGARDADVRYFLAPRANCGDVSGHVPDGLEVVEVATFDDAVAAVDGIAKGDISGLPSCGTR